MRAMVAVVASLRAGSTSLPSMAFMSVDLPLDMVATTAISNSLSKAFLNALSMSSLFLITSKGQPGLFSSL